MGRICAAYGCNNYDKMKCKGITFHRFPMRHPQLVKQWLVKISMEDYVPHTNSALCSIHFSEDCFTYQNFTNIRKLKTGSIPTKFLHVGPKAPQQQQPSKKYSELMKAFPCTEPSSTGLTLVTDNIHVVQSNNINASSQSEQSSLSENLSTDGFHDAQSEDINASLQSQPSSLSENLNTGGIHDTQSEDINASLQSQPSSLSENLNTGGIHDTQSEDINASLQSQPSSLSENLNTGGIHDTQSEDINASLQSQPSSLSENLNTGGIHDTQSEDINSSLQKVPSSSIDTLKTENIDVVKRNKIVVEFASYSDMKNAISKLKDTELSGCKIQISRSSRSMGRYCAAYGCKNSDKKQIKGITFHGFPLRNPTLVKHWLLRIRRQDFVPNNHSTVCSVHFAEDCFSYEKFTNRRLLKPGAIPTTFLHVGPKAPQQQLPSNKYSELINVSLQSEPSSLSENTEHTVSQSEDIQLKTSSIPKTFLLVRRKDPVNQQQQPSKCNAEFFASLQSEPSSLSENTEHTVSQSEDIQLKTSSIPKKFLLVRRKDSVNQQQQPSKCNAEFFNASLQSEPSSLSENTEHTVSQSDDIQLKTSSIPKKFLLVSQKDLVNKKQQPSKLYAEFLESYSERKLSSSGVTLANDNINVVQSNNIKFSQRKHSSTGVTLVNDNINVVQSNNTIVNLQSEPSSLGENLNTVGFHVAQSDDINAFSQLEPTSLSENLNTDGFHVAQSEENNTFSHTKPSSSRVTLETDNINIVQSSNINACLQSDLSSLSNNLNTDGCHVAQSEDNNAYSQTESSSPRVTFETDYINFVQSSNINAFLQSEPSSLSENLYTDGFHDAQSEDMDCLGGPSSTSYQLISAENAVAQMDIEQEDHTVDSSCETDYSVSLIGELSKVKAENEALTRTLKQELCRNFFSFTSIKTNTQMQAITGFDKKEFIAVYKFLNLKCVQLGKLKKNNINKFLLFLVKLKTGICNEFLSVLFGISATSVSRIFIRIVNVLHEKLKMLNQWPDKNQIKMNLPPEIQSTANIRVILDIAEFEIESPESDLKNQLTFSKQTNKNTFKALVGIAPSGSISFISDLYCGSISNKEIVIESGILDKLEKGDIVLASKEFQIEKELTEKGCVFKEPVFLNDKIQFDMERSCNSHFSYFRVYIDRAISRIQTYKYFEGSLTATSIHNVNEVFFITCMLTNFQKSQYIKVNTLTHLYIQKT